MNGQPSKFCREASRGGKLKKSKILKRAPNANFSIHNQRIFTQDKQLTSTVHFYEIMGWYQKIGWVTTTSAVKSGTDI